MADYATLVYDIDSTAARSAATDLAKMNAAAVTASGGADKLNKTLRDQQGRFRSAADVTEQYGNEVRNLAAKYNPVLSAVYQYQQAQVELNRAVMLGVVTQQQAEASLATMAAGMQRTAGSARNLGNMQGTVGNQFAQLNDVVVTAWGGMNPALIGMQQGMQMVQGFAGQSLPQALGTLKGAFMTLLSPTTLLTIGVVAGTAALIQYASGFLVTAENTKTAQERVDAFAASVNAVNTIAQNYSNTGLSDMIGKYGEINASLLLMIERQREFAVNAAMADGVAAVRALGEQYTALNGSIDLFAKTGRGDFAALTSELGLNKNQVVALGRAYKDALSAQTPEQLSAAVVRMNAVLNVSSIRVDDLSKNLVDAEAAARELANSAPQASWMNAAISGVQSLYSTIVATINKNNELSGSLGGGIRPRGRPMDLGDNRTDSEISGGGGAGGGSGVDQAQAAWDALNAVQYSGVLKNLETLKWGLDQKLISEQAYNKRRQEMLLMEFGTDAQQNIIRFQTDLALLNTQFDQKLIAEEAYLIKKRQLQIAYGEALQQGENNRWSVELNGLSSGFAEMNKLAGGGYDKLLHAQQIFSAASALMSTYTGAAKALELPFPQNLIAMGKVLAAGMGLVSAIKGGGKSGGSSSAASTATSAAKAEPTKNILVRLEGPDFLVDMAENIMTQIYEASSNGRVIIAKDRQ